MPSAPRQQKTRGFTFTNYDVVGADYQKVIDECKQVRYLAYGGEVCPNTGRDHHQGFVYFHNQKTTGARSLKKLCTMLKVSHMEGMKGSFAQNEAYCSKEGELHEFGVAPTQGARGDIVACKDDILAGKLTADDIALDNPEFYHQYGRTFNKIEDIALRRKSRSSMTVGVWLHGPTGVGKSYAVYKSKEFPYSPDKFYTLNLQDKGWWDGYTGQETVVFNEFRGQIPYGELLDLVDWTPKTVKRRNREPVPFLAKRLWITSSMHPTVVYQNVAEKDSMDQLLRRFRIIHIKDRESAQKCSMGNTNPLSTSASPQPEVESTTVRAGPMVVSVTRPVVPPVVRLPNVLTVRRPHVYEVDDGADEEPFYVSD